MKIEAKERRKKRVRARIKRETKRKYKLVVFRSSRWIEAQIVDLESGKTICGVHGKSVVGADKGKHLTKTQVAFKVGKAIAKKAKEAGIKEVVFDRGSFRFHGRVAAVAEGARKAGLII